jgi:hypothetical protein
MLQEDRLNPKELSMAEIEQKAGCIIESSGDTDQIETEG